MHIENVYKIERLIDSYKHKPEIEEYKYARPCYNIADNRISIPSRYCYPSLTHFYCTLAHELVHSTLVRFDRKRLFFYEAYEELTAVIGSFLLLRAADIDWVNDVDPEYAESELSWALYHGACVDLEQCYIHSIQERDFLIDNLTQYVFDMCWDKADEAAQFIAANSNF